MPSCVHIAEARSRPARVRRTAMPAEHRITRIVTRRTVDVRCLAADWLRRKKPKSKSRRQLQVSEFAVPVPNTGQTKTRSTYVLLGVLLGAFGAHNFYAGNRNRALIQLGITVLTLGYGSPFSWIWAVIEV